MGTLKARWEALVEAIDRRLNSHRHDAFYNGDRRGASGRPSTVARAPRESLAPRLLAGLMIVSAVVMLMFVAAAGIVNAFSSHTVTRLTHAKAEQLAASEYRKARAQCQRLSGTPREACIADAHAAEERARAVSAMTRKDYFAMLRAQTDAAIDAGDRDAIVVEPACNIVARGQGTLCEIQVKPGSLAMPGTNLIPAAVKSPQFATYARPERLAPVHLRQGPPVRYRYEPIPTARSATAAQYDDRFIELAWSSRQ